MDLVDQYQESDGGSIGDDDHASGHRADAAVRFEILLEIVERVGGSRPLVLEKRLDLVPVPKTEQTLDLALRQRTFVVRFDGEALQNAPRQIVPLAGERFRYIVGQLES